MSDYTRVLKGLRHCINLDGLEPNDTRIRCHGCPYFTEPTRCGGILMRDAAAAIEDLQAQLPKRGEWIVKGANRIDCSVCGHSVCFAFGLSEGSLDLYKYCPECGAKMEAQDA